MTFAEAIQEITNGKWLSRKEWGNPNIYLLVWRGALSIHHADGHTTTLIVTDGDLLGDDWYVVEPTLAPASAG